MHACLIPSVLMLSLLTACAGTTAPTATPGVPLASMTAELDAYTTSERLRLLAEGSFTLPSALVSVGSGNLVSVGSGSLVSVGSGHYSVLASDMVPVPQAEVALLNPAGREVGVSRVKTDDDGRFRIVGRAAAGVYVVTAGLGQHQYRSLTALRQDMAVEAPVDIATTLVSAKLLAKKAIEVLPAAAYAETVEAVRRVLASEGLPAGWTPDQAEATMTRLEGKYVVLRERLSALEAEQARLEQRLAELEYRIQALSAQLEVPSGVLSRDLRAVLSQNPKASDEEVKASVRARRASSKTPEKAASPAPAATTAPTPEPSAAPTASSQPSAAPAVFNPFRPTLGNKTKGAERPWFPTVPSAEPGAPAPTPELTAAPSEVKDKGKGKEKGSVNGQGQGLEKTKASVLEQGSFGGLPAAASKAEASSKPAGKKK